MTQICYVTQYCVDVSASVPEYRDMLVSSAMIRAEVLGRCYRIPGYETLTYKEKRPIYNRVRAKVMEDNDIKEVNKNGR